MNDPDTDGIKHGVEDHFGLTRHGRQWIPIGDRMARKPTNPDARVIVTGGCGFIGSHLIRHLLRRGHRVLNLDKLSYAADPRNLADVAGDPAYEFLRIDLCDEAATRAAFTEFMPARVFHLAAESHVDRSITEPADFLQSNILGTASVLRAAHDAWRDDSAHPLFIQFSTDEVYGALGDGDAGFLETSPYAPNSPYAASKAAADHLARAWAKTYDLPVVRLHATNVYGTHQHPEKLIPRVITHAIRGEKVPVFGHGRQRREWLHVDDGCEALLAVSRNARPGGIFHASSGDDWENLRLIERIVREIRAGDPFDLIRHVADRPGHDARYALAGPRLRDRLAWHPARRLESELPAIISWYKTNPGWWHGK